MNEQAIIHLDNDVTPLKLVLQEESQLQVLADTPHGMSFRYKGWTIDLLVRETARIVHMTQSQRMALDEVMNTRLALVLVVNDGRETKDPVYRALPDRLTPPLLRQAVASMLRELPFDDDHRRPDLLAPPR